MTSNLIINGIYIMLHYVTFDFIFTHFDFAVFFFCILRPLRQGNGDRLSAPRREDSPSLPAHSYGAAARRDLDAEGTREPVCPCLPVLWMKNLRSKKGRDLPEIRVLGLPELFFSFSFKRIFKGELPKLRGMTSWMVKVVDAWESSDKSTCTPHVCTTMSNSHQLIWTASQRSVREIQAGVSTSCWNLAEIPIADSDLAKPPSECSREWKSSSKTLPPRANPGQR